MPLPEISVIIPHLSQPTALAACLTALDGQRSGSVPFEVLVVDNGSRVLPTSVCAAFDWVTLAQEAKPGPGPARSLGAKLAKGEILAFIDADCIASPAWIGAILGFFSTNPGIDVIGGDVQITRDGPMNQIAAYEAIYGYRMQMYVERDHYTATCNMAVRKPVFAAVGDFADISIAEDVDWGQRATAMGYRISYVAEVGITTPARATFAELSRKWRRHIGHDYEGTIPLPLGRLRWTFRALSLAASPVIELPKILRSERVFGLRERFLALICLVRIRFYRAWIMLGLLFHGDSKALSAGWRT